MLCRQKCKKTIKNKNSAEKYGSRFGHQFKLSERVYGGGDHNTTIYNDHTYPYTIYKKNNDHIVFFRNG